MMYLDIVHNIWRSLLIFVFLSTCIFGQFTQLKNACISGNNKEVYRGVMDVRVCQAQCSTSTSFQCHSFEFNQRTQTCQLSSLNSLTASMYYREPCNVQGWVYAQRVAAEERVCAASELCDGLFPPGSVRCKCRPGYTCQAVPGTSDAFTCRLSKPVSWSRPLPACILGNNLVSFVEAVNIDVCKNECLKRPTCRSVEFNYFKQRCNLSQMDSSSSSYRRPCTDAGWYYTEKIAY